MFLSTMIRFMNPFSLFCSVKCYINQFLSFPIAVSCCNSIVPLPIAVPSKIILSLFTICSTGKWTLVFEFKLPYSIFSQIHHQIVVQCNPSQFSKYFISNSIAPRLTNHPLNIQPHSFYLRAITK